MIQNENFPVRIKNLEGSQLNLIGIFLQDNADCVWIIVLRQNKFQILVRIYEINENSNEIRLVTNTELNDETILIKDIYMIQIETNLEQIMIICKDEKRLLINFYNRYQLKQPFKQKRSSQIVEILDRFPQIMINNSRTFIMINQKIYNQIDDWDGLPIYDGSSLQIYKLNLTGMVIEKLNVEYKDKCYLKFSNKDDDFMYYSIQKNKKGYEMKKTNLQNLLGQSRYCQVETLDSLIQFDYHEDLQLLACLSESQQIRIYQIKFEDQGNILCQTDLHSSTIEFISWSQEILLIFNKNEIIIFDSCLQILSMVKLQDEMKQLKYCQKQQIQILHNNNIMDILHNQNNVYTLEYQFKMDAESLIQMRLEKKQFQNACDLTSVQLQKNTIDFNIPITLINYGLNMLELDQFVILNTNKLIQIYLEKLGDRREIQFDRKIRQYFNHLIYQDHIDHAYQFAKRIKNVQFLKNILNITKLNQMHFFTSKIQKEIESIKPLQKPSNIEIQLEKYIMNVLSSQQDIKILDDPQQYYKLIMNINIKEINQAIDDEIQQKYEESYKLYEKNGMIESSERVKQKFKSK